MLAEASAPASAELITEAAGSMDFLLGPKVWVVER